MTNLLIALAGLIILSAALAPIIGAWLRSRQPAPTCGNCRYFALHFDGLLCGRRALRRLRTDQACNVGEIDG